MRKLFATILSATAVLCVVSCGQSAQNAQDVESLCDSVENRTKLVATEVIKGDASVMMNSGKFDEAMALFDCAEKITADDPVIAFAKSWIWDNRGEADSARVYALKARRLFAARQSDTPFGDALNSAACTQILSGVDAYRHELDSIRELCINGAYTDFSAGDDEDFWNEFANLDVRTMFPNNNQGGFIPKW